ncbi:NnrU protein [Hasllibacter halocynthiae]|uniref:NnrU protein n=1 Tax=Hasllibacter halocynthiae TaxID=595589 RepID=A0A2T0X163_9RHOB|nr:NnrU family protein [Hasllibacter halocynthiae]PRY92688.1 NnrU protein [Hasllibacter halocynthiae]
MGYLLLVSGVALWSGAHLWKRLAPASRARLGDPGKGLVALALVLSLVLMVYGYRWAAWVPLWYPPLWLTHLNNLLTLLAVWLFVASNAGGRIGTRMRHPQLTAVKIWAVAHLLVNGDLAAVVLFGGLLAWAVAEVILINRRAAWSPSAPGPLWRDAAAFAAALALWLLIAWVHVWLGVWPFGGTPG